MRGIFIDNGKTVKEYSNISKKVEKAIIAILEEIEDVMYAETHEGYTVDIKERE